MSIPFTKIGLSGREIEYMTAAVNHGHIHGDGPFTKQCEDLFTQRFGTPRALLTCSGTAALEMGTLLANLEPGDEVIMPSFTFVSTANAVVLRRAVPVFVDIRPDTLNLDETLIEGAITQRTRGIIPVHYAGVSCEMDRIMAVAAAHKLFVLEDAAHGYGATYHGRALGTIGDFGMLSFHQTKNLSSGEGGALFINAQEYIDRAEIIREKGTNRKQFVRGVVDKYSWCDIGSSFLPSDILAAFLLAQCEYADELIASRQAAYQLYMSRLADVADRYDIQLPTIPQNCEHNGHIFYILLKTPALRDQLQLHLKNHGIASTSHYVPLHESIGGQKYGKSHGSLPITCQVAGQILRLPLYSHMKDADIDFVVTTIHQFFATSSHYVAQSGQTTLSSHTSSSHSRSYIENSDSFAP